MQPPDHDSKPLAPLDAAPERREDELLVDFITEIISRELKTPPTPKLAQLAGAIVDRLRVFRGQGPRDVIAVFVSEREPKPPHWLSRFLDTVRIAFCDENGMQPRLLVLPVEMDLQRVPPEQLPGLRDKIKDLHDALELFIAGGSWPYPQQAPAPPVAESGPAQQGPPGEPAAG